MPQTGIEGSRRGLIKKIAKGGAMKGNGLKGNAEKMDVKHG